MPLFAQICGSFESETTTIHAINLDHVIPFYNPSNIPFAYNQSTRKSFSRGTPKMKLSLKNLSENNNEHSNSLGSKDISSPSSFEMIDESLEEAPAAVAPSVNDFAFEKYARNRESYLYSLPADNFTNIQDVTHVSSSDADDNYIDNYTNDLDYYPTKANQTMKQDFGPEREDFPVNCAQLPDYAPKMDGIQQASAKSIKTKSVIQRKVTANNQNNKLLSQTRKLSSSTIDLHTMNDSTANYSSSRKTISRNGSPTRNYSALNNNNTNNGKARRSEVTKETIHARNNRKITVQIMAKPPPTRSKTSIDLRGNSTPTGSLPSSASSNLIPSNGSSSSGPRSIHQSSFNHSSSGSGVSGTAEEGSSIQQLATEHERIFQELSNRYATIQLIRNRSQDIGGALRHVIKMHDHSVLVDLLGAILEKP